MSKLSNSGAKYQHIRDSFTKFFESKGHKSIPSSSIVPQDDATLMFVNSGMVQFKNYFTGVETPDFNSAVTIQKCIRASGKHNDLDNVGHTARHHTFFEMLGNFSFGEYFKEDAIKHAWEFLTKEMGIDSSKLCVTVWHEDEESRAIWKEVSGFGDDRIISIDTSDNFWSMGDEGPCGPCSEIYYDHGESVAGGMPGTEDAEGDRWVEIWNLVFMQYNKQKDCEQTTLKTKCIDTGMGIERLAAILEGKVDNYDTSMFVNLISAAQEIYGDDEKHTVAFRVVADHIRSISFLIAEGVSPSNIGSGYVLRRIMRRAMRFLHQINPNEAKMSKLFASLDAEMGSHYPELRAAKDTIIHSIQVEEESFKDALDRGMKILTKQTSHLKSGDMLDGATAFLLYDTYGFPLDLTADIMRDCGIVVDMAGFEKALEEQKERGRASWKGSRDGGDKNDFWFAVCKDIDDKCKKFGVESHSKFVGYSKNDISTRAVFAHTEECEGKDKLWIILEETPFYAESGGQKGDIGIIKFENATLKVVDTKKKAGGKLIAHQIDLEDDDGMIFMVDNDVDKISDCIAIYNEEDRLNKSRNHSATHLLQAALREKFGTHVVQKGSQVYANKFRFDFNHSKPITKEEIAELEDTINGWIKEDLNVSLVHTTKEKATEMGAMALFGEKYEDDVRVVLFGKDEHAAINGESVSTELCGGTHVEKTSDIPAFKILSAKSIGSGIKRIEATTNP